MFETHQGTYCSQSMAYFNAMTQKPTAQRKQVIDRFIRGLISTGLWFKFDMLYLLAAHHEQASRLHLITPGTKTLTITGVWTAATGFIADRGWTNTAAAAATDYLDPATNMSQLTNFTQNSAHMGVWSTTDNKQAANRSYDFGDTNNVAVIGRSDNGSGALYLHPNFGSSLDTAASSYYPGHAMWSRTASASWAAYGQGGAVSTTGVDVSTALSSGIIRICNIGTSGSVNQIAMVHMGSQFSATDAATMYSLSRAYMNGVGASA